MVSISQKLVQQDKKIKCLCDKIKKLTLDLDNIQLIVGGGSSGESGGESSGGAADDVIGQPGSGELIFG
jgi:hypothetical protein